MVVRHHVTRGIQLFSDRVLAPLPKSELVLSRTSERRRHVFYMASLCRVKFCCVEDKRLKLSGAVPPSLTQKEDSGCLQVAPQSLYCM